MLDCRHVKTYDDAVRWIDSITIQIDNLGVKFPPYGSDGIITGPIEKWHKMYNDLQAAIKYLKRTGIYWEESDREDIYC